MSGSDEAAASGLGASAMTPAQTRAARALLGWSPAQLAAEAGFDEAALRAFEDGYSDAGSGAIESLRSALMRAGIQFSGDGSQGVSLREQGRGEGTRLDALTTENDR